MFEAKDIKHIIAVSSGKGGVGKSTVSANLAVALSREGYRTGLLDADIYTPSIPVLFGCEEMRTDMDGGFILPVHKFGVELMSIGFFLLPDQPVVWRGPMVTNVVKQFFTEVAWGALDYLIIDMPPGTGDVALTVIQNVPLTGVTIVTTPQNVALHDVRRTVAMFQDDNIKISVLGVVENMSWFTPQELPNNKYYIFGKDGGKKLAADLGMNLLTQIPLIQSVAESGDKGTPAATYGEQPVAKYFMELADKITERIT